MADLVRLEYSDAKSNKFWQVSIEGASHTVCYGKIGSAGTAKTTSFGSDEEARKSADKLIASKKKKGYSEVGACGESEPATKKTESSTKNPAKKNFDASAFEKKFGVLAPTRFQEFVSTSEAKKYAKSYIENLPGYTSDSKFRITFCKPSFELFDENDVERGDYEEAWMPLAQIDEEPEFLAVNLSDEACPVAMWQHETGMFEPIAPSLDAFLGALVAKAHKPKINVLKAALTKAKALHEKKKDQEAVELLEGALVGWKPGRQIMDGNQGHVPAAYNLLGICLGKVDRLDDAMQAYKNAVESGTVYAGLNILSAYASDYNDPVKVIEYSKELEGKYLDAYCWFWIRKYLGEAYIATGASTEAEAEFRAILERFQSEDLEKMDAVIESLQEYLKDGKPNPKIAQSVLTWFRKKDYSVTEEQAKDNRDWWEALPEFVRSTLKAEIKIKGEVSDEDIARVFDVKSLTLDDDHELDEVSLLTRLSGLTRLSFHGNPTTLEPLRSLSALERVTLNRKVIKDLELPDTSSQALFDAITAGDLDAIRKALASGANVNAKEESFANSGLHVAVMNHDVDDTVRQAMALLLVESGADPYAQNMDDDDVFAYCGPDTAELLRDVFAKRGGTAPGDGPFKLATAGRAKAAVSLGDIKGFDNEHELKDGVPLLADYPSGSVTAQMRTNYPGHKKDTRLYDYHEVYGRPIISAKLRAFLEGQGVAKAEFLPITILDHKGGIASEEYFIFNPLAQDCLNLKASEPDYNLIDDTSISEVKQLVIDADRVEADAFAFRIQAYCEPLVFRTALATAVLEAGFINIDFALPKR